MVAHYILNVYIKNVQDFLLPMFFKHVQLHKYDLTDKGISQACYDEMRGEGLDLVLGEDEMRHLADFKREQFKDYMRPLFA